MMKVVHKAAPNMVQKGTKAAKNAPMVAKKGGKAAKPAIEMGPVSKKVVGMVKKAAKALKRA